MDWKAIAAKLANMGLPILAKVIGGEISKIPIAGTFFDMAGGAGMIESVGRKAIAMALGVDATPEAVNAAIESKPTTEVVANLQGVQSGLAERFGMVAEIAKSDNETDARLAQINSESYAARLRAEAGSNSFWQSLYRPIGLWGCTFLLLYLVGLILYAATFGGDVRANLTGMETMIGGVLASLFGVIFGHFATRASERKALLAPPPVVTPPAAVVPVATPIKAITKR